MVLNRNILTLDEFTIQEMRAFPQATGQLSGLLRDIGLAAKRINVEVNKAGLVDILGDYGSVNVQGEEVKKLDMLNVFLLLASTILFYLTILLIAEKICIV